MKCTDCVNWEGGCSYNLPEPVGEAEDECEEFSILCCICNSDIVATTGSCCEDLQATRRSEGNPCRGYPVLPDCKGCPGIKQKEA